MLTFMQFQTMLKPGILSSVISSIRCKILEELIVSSGPDLSRGTRKADSNEYNISKKVKGRKAQKRQKCQK
jgi:hypothetical protein